MVIRPDKIVLSVIIARHLSSNEINNGWAALHFLKQQVVIGSSRNPAGIQIAVIRQDFSDHRLVAHAAGYDTEELQRPFTISFADEFCLFDEVSATR